MRKTGIYIKSAFILLILLLTSLPGLTQEESSLTKKQSPLITKILDNEKKIENLKPVINIIKMIDTTYGDLYTNLKEGKKIIIFFDPAHGLLPSGEWQGAVTGRMSCTNLPEEYYCILFSRKMYELLSKNKFIEVRSTPEFMSVLKDESDIYYNIPFQETIRLANEAGAFMIISEHLNNVASTKKASGLSNMTGLHVTFDRRGRKILKYIDSSHNGFLTLYNKLDASGFSKNYAVKLKRMLTEKGFKANSWDFGAVGDDRFSYFVDFPISIIYESGFISNPDEEEKLRDPSYIDSLVNTQYEALIENICSIFGVDISGSFAFKTDKETEDRLDLLKMARIAVHYIKKGDTDKCIPIIRDIEKKYTGTDYEWYISYYSDIRRKVENAEHYYRLGLANSRKKRYGTARRHFLRARRCINRAPIFSAYRYKYARALGRRASREICEESRPSIQRKAKVPVTVTRAPLSRYIILPVEEGCDLKKAVSLALDPDEKAMELILESLKKAKICTYERARKYSKKKKKYIRYWKRIEERVTFKKGIYLLKLNKKLNVVAVKHVKSVELNPDKYQNQQYLKNSYFGPTEKHKDL
ncbi:MAG TPA: N-acetylmuramoyl-L-alanine amidase [Spirochaetota bacterium]|nr:N-acetylmuramoyl-L-alanine amidase [Spirochaetota bacterium]HPI90818.1 N-acetylmuramoyl-L-alanine amidase [Spirochaetota bacterium]